MYACKIKTLNIHRQKIVKMCQIDHKNKLMKAYGGGEVAAVGHWAHSANRGRGQAVLGEVLIVERVPRGAQALQSIASHHLRRGASRVERGLHGLFSRIKKD